MENDATILDNEVQNELNAISFWQGLGIGFLFLLLQTIFSLPFIIGGPFLEISDKTSLGISLIFSFPLASLVLYKYNGLKTNIFQWENYYLLLIPVGFITCSAIAYIPNTLMSLLPIYEQLLEMYKTMFEGIPIWALLIGGAIIGPICEEIIFRGIILEKLSRRYSITKAILFSAFIFGFIHLVPIQVINAFFIGVVLAWVYIKTQSLWVCIFIHILNNSIAFLFDDSDTLPREYFDNDLLFIGSFFLAAVVAFIGYLTLKNIFNRNSL